jgi:hypothetical protein
MLASLHLRGVENGTQVNILNVLRVKCIKGLNNPNDNYIHISYGTSLHYSRHY